MTLCAASCMGQVASVNLFVSSSVCVKLCMLSCASSCCVELSVHVLCGPLSSLKILRPGVSYIFVGQAMSLTNVVKTNGFTTRYWVVKARGK